MSLLTSLLVRDQVVPVRKIEEAIQRQVISGGEIETALLEMGVVQENILNAYCAALYGEPPAAVDEVMTASREVIKLVPREAAERHRLVPTAVEGGLLLLATARPLSRETLDELGFLLGRNLSLRIVTEPRLALALAHHYGIEMPPRLRRLGEKLRTRDPGQVPYVEPAEPARVDGDRAKEVAKTGTIWDDGEGPHTERDGFALSPEEARGTPTDPSPASEIPGEPTQPSAKVPVHTNASSDGVASPDGISAAVAGVVKAGTHRAPAAPAGGSERRRQKSTVPDMPAIAASRRARRRARGPLLPKEAAEMLGEAVDRDEILAIYFGFVRQFFDYTALFVVHDDVAEGRDAFGSGAAAQHVRGIAVPLDVPGSFGEARRTVSSSLVDLRANELDRVVARDLRREGSQPALLVPIAIRGRVVLMLYADQGGEAFELKDIPEVIAATPRVTEAFERLILRRKKTGGYESGGGASAPPAARGGAAVGGAIGSGGLAPKKSSEQAKSASMGAWSAAADHSSERSATSPSPPREASLERSSPRSSSPPAPARSRTDPAYRMRSGSGPIEALLSSPSANTDGQPSTEDRRRDTIPIEDRVGPGRRQRRSVLGMPTAERPSNEPEGEIEPESVASSVAQSAPSETGTRADGESQIEREHESQTEREHESQIEAESQTQPDEPIVRDTVQTQQRPSHHSAGSYSLRDASTEVIGPAAHRINTLSEPPPPGDAPSRPESNGAGVALHGEGTSAGSGESGHRDRSPRMPGPAGSEPSVIVDMGDQIEDLVADLCASGPEDDAAAVRTLLSTGPAVLPALVQHFPGPLWFDRTAPHRRLPRGRDVSAIARALVAFGPTSAPYLAPLIDARDEEIRFYATLVASEFIHPELIFPLANRLYDEDAQTRNLTCDVLRLQAGLTEKMEELFRVLRATARYPGKEPGRRMMSTLALGELRDVAAVPLLIELLEDEDEAVFEAAHSSLVAITRQDFGGSSKKWRNWLEKNAERHRIEWLIDGLLHQDERIRADSGEELGRVTQEYYGYHPELPKRDREIAHRKYLKWWQEEGHERFLTAR